MESAWYVVRSAKSVGTSSDGSSVPEISDRARTPAQSPHRPRSRRPPRMPRKPNFDRDPSSQAHPRHDASLRLSGYLGRSCNHVQPVLAIEWSAPYLYDRLHDIHECGQVMSCCSCACGMHIRLHVYMSSSSFPMRTQPRAHFACHSRIPMIRLQCPASPAHTRLTVFGNATFAVSCSAGGFLLFLAIAAGSLGTDYHIPAEPSGVPMHCLSIRARPKAVVYAGCACVSVGNSRR